MKDCDLADINDNIICVKIFDSLIAKLSKDIWKENSVIAIGLNTGECHHEHCDTSYSMRKNGPVSRSLIIHVKFRAVHNNICFSSVALYCLLWNDIYHTFAPNAIVISKTIMLVRMFEHIRSRSLTNKVGPLCRVTQSSLQNLSYIFLNLPFLHALNITATYGLVLLRYI